MVRQKLLHLQLGITSPEDGVGTFGSDLLKQHRIELFESFDQSCGSFYNFRVACHDDLSWSRMVVFAVGMPPPKTDCNP